MKKIHSILKFIGGRFCKFLPPGKGVSFHLMDGGT